MASGFTYTAEYDGIQLDVISTSTSHGRTLVPHRFPKRDGAQLEDMGREPLVASLEFVFVDNRFVAAGGGDYLDRFEAFELVVEDGTSRLLIHPYLGSINARVSDFSHRGNADGSPAIWCSATFTEELGLDPVFDPEDLGQTRVGAQAVRATALQAEAELEAIGADTTNVLSAITTAENWETDPELSARQVQLEMATLNNRLSSELDSLNAATDLTRHPVMKQYTSLQYALQKAAQSFTTTTTRLVKINVTEPLPLRVIASRFYGAAEAERRFDELRELNPAIRNPSIVPAGTELTAYSRTVEPRRFA